MTTLHEEHYGGTISENDLIPEEVENEECVDSKLSKTPVKPQKLNLFSTNSINEVCSLNRYSLFKGESREYVTYII